MGALTQAPNELIKEKLYKIKHDKYCLPYIDLAIGARVMITKNFARCTHTAIQEEYFPTVNSFHTLKNRELPIVFVKMDKYTGIQISPDVDKQNIVPFTECINEVPLTVNGTSYMHW